MSLPVVKKIAWISLVPQLGLLAILTGLYYILGVKHAILFSALTYLMMSNLARFLVLKHHNRAVKFVKAEDFRSAIRGFQSSYDFLSTYPWIDKYRYMTLLSSSKLSFREMALNNIAFSHAQIGEGDQAILYYNKMLTEFPNSDLAETALNFIDAFKSDR
ncbi:tol-pal system YbgF family protein [Dyadobacter sp. CY347]|uniref:tetratricopeptide repeat protein n=1 Tax=Dyadobacter sp. CY347 TaxID=2909336 RepID=UPI001F1B7CDF|nr:hypothetical protein [Dyadobacter sp. CY347]MCF2489899.1 hypothetical protein [Dyadobacter sp. CY347]